MRVERRSAIMLTAYQYSTTVFHLIVPIRDPPLRLTCQKERPRGSDRCTVGEDLDTRTVPGTKVMLRLVRVASSPSSQDQSHR